MGLGSSRKAVTVEEAGVVSSQSADQLTLAAEFANLTPLKEFIVLQAERHGVGPGQCLRIEVAFDDLLANVISYAYPAGGGPVTVACDGDGSGFRLTIIDQGEPFDPLSVSDPDPDLRLEDREIGGLGVFLARQMAEELRYERRSDQNVLTISFKKR